MISNANLNGTLEVVAGAVSNKKERKKDCGNSMGQATSVKGMAGGVLGWSRGEKTGRKKWDGLKPGKC